jgi:hypothetical protein
MHGECNVKFRCWMFNKFVLNMNFLDIFFGIMLLYMVTTFCRTSCNVAALGFEQSKLSLCSRDFLEKLIVSQLVQSPKLYGTWSLITMFRQACHLSLFWARLIQLMPSQFIPLRCSFTIILPSMPRSLFQVSPPKACIIFLLPHLSHIPYWS